MAVAYPIAAVVLLLTLIAGLLRIWWGPTAADRMLAGQLLGTTGVALLLVLGDWLQHAALRDVALTLALLALLSTVAFVARAWDSDQAQRPGDTDERI